LHDTAGPGFYPGFYFCNMPGKKLIVIGGGAAGFFCAVNAARLNQDLEVILLEKTTKLLSKVKVSGGGRCNVTHACFDIVEMSKRYPRGQHFVKKLFHQFFTTDTIQWFEDRGVKLKIEGDGRMFPVTDSSQTIIDCLLREAEKYRVKIVLSSEVKALAKTGNEFDLLIDSHGHSNSVQADFVCVACGGYPKSLQFEWLSQLGHSIENPVPSLFTFNLPGHALTKLMGVSVSDVKCKIIGTKLEERGPLLVTHWGLSGPAILRVSAWGARELAAKNWKFLAQINWIPSLNEQSVGQEFQNLRHERASQRLGAKNPFNLPQRLWEFLLVQASIEPGVRWADLPAKDQNRLARNLTAFEVNVLGKTTFKEEFVTAGGVRLAEIDAQKMESKKVPGLFFAGEVVDVDGITGGYNFQHAWSSAFTAALAIASN
jgi:predicted Rossmann fold flavoprotein